MAEGLISTCAGNTINQVMFVGGENSSTVGQNHGTSFCVNTTIQNVPTSPVCMVSNPRVFVNQESDSSSGCGSGGHIAPDKSSIPLQIVFNPRVFVNQESDSSSGCSSGGHIAPDKPSTPVQMVSNPPVFLNQERDFNKGSSPGGHIAPEESSVPVRVVQNEVRDLNSGSSGTNEQSAAVRTDGINVVDPPAPPGRPTCGICQKTGHRMVSKSKTPCGHLFCYRCIRTWVDESPSVVNCFTCHRVIDSFIHHGRQTYYIYPIGPDGKRRKPSAPGLKQNKVRTPRPRRRNRGGGGNDQH